jgi:hypothetical protein
MLASRQKFGEDYSDPLYFNHLELLIYVALDKPLYDGILAGAIRLGVRMSPFHRRERGDAVRNQSSAGIHGQ